MGIDIDRAEFLRRAALLGVSAPFLMGARSKKALSRTRRRRRTRIRARRGVAPEGAPNILWIQTDDHPEHAKSVMPRLRQRISSTGGVDLGPTGYAITPMCAPNRAGALLSIYTHRHAIKTNTRAFQIYRNQNYASRDVVTRMNAGGYVVGFFGKFMNSYGTDDKPGTWVHPNAARWHVMASGQNNYPYIVNKDGAIIRNLMQNTTAHFGEAGESFMRAGRTWSAPWICFMNWIDPHNPGFPARAHEHAFDGARYKSPGVAENTAAELADKGGFPPNPVSGAERQDQWEGIAEELRTVDAWIDRLFGMLQETGQLDNTIVFVTADNGWMLGEHGGVTAKSHAWEESSRVPYFVRGPGLDPDALRGKLVCTADLSATALSCAGVMQPDLDGRDLRDASSASSANWRRRLLFEHPGRGWHAVRDDDGHVYIEGTGYGEQIYNLNDDPYQLENRRGDPAYAAKVAELQTSLRAMKQSGGEELRTLEVAA
jgi:extracellular sulfatase Sulf